MGLFSGREQQIMTTADSLKIMNLNSEISSAKDDVNMLLGIIICKRKMTATELDYFSKKYEDCILNYVGFNVLRDAVGSESVKERD